MKGLGRPAAALLLVAILFASVSTAYAHTELITARPAPGETVATPPAEIVLTFSEPIAQGSTFLILTDAFQEIPGLAPSLDPADPTRLVSAVPDGALVEAIYTVQWFVTSADGHPASGSYTFAVGDGARTGLDPGGLALAAALILLAFGLAWLAALASRESLT